MNLSAIKLGIDPIHVHTSCWQYDGDICMNCNLHGITLPFPVSWTLTENCSVIFAVKKDVPFAQLEKFSLLIGWP
jgi:hypothetical protein